MKILINTEPKRDYMRLTPNEKRFKSYKLTPKERKDINQRLIKTMNNGKSIHKR